MNTTRPSNAGDSLLKSKISLHGRINLRAALKRQMGELPLFSVFQNMQTKQDAKWWFRYDVVGCTPIKKIADGAFLLHR